jgi:membrane associated rhomboid family serine protease
MRGPARHQHTPDWVRPLTQRLTPTITVLVVLNAFLFAFYALVKPARMFVQDHLALGPAVLAGLELWQLVTSLFVHLDPISFFFNLIGLWFVGATIERELGRSKFLVLFFVPAVIGNAVMAVLWAAAGSSDVTSGSSLGVLSLFVAFGKVYNRTPARVFGSLVLEARTLTLILVGFALLADLTRGSWVALVGDVVAITLAYLLVGGRGGGLRELWNRLRGRGGRRRFGVVEGGREDRKSPYLN